MDKFELATQALNDNLWEIRYELMELFRWHAENYRIIGFDFWEHDYDMNASEDEPKRILFIKQAFFQVTELYEMEPLIEAIIADYIDEDCFASWIYVGNEWLYIEIHIDDFS